MPSGLAQVLMQKLRDELGSLRVEKCVTTMCRAVQDLKTDQETVLLVLSMQLVRLIDRHLRILISM